MKVDDIMNSHDVVSLFTNVTINKVMVVIRKWLEGAKTFKSRTNLTPNVMSLLDFVMSMTNFQFDGEFTNRSTEHPWGVRSPWL